MKNHPMRRLVSLLPTGSWFNHSVQGKKLGLTRKDPHEENFYGCEKPMPPGFTLPLQALSFACPAVRSLGKFNLKYPNFFKKECFRSLISHLKKRVFSADFGKLGPRLGCCPTPLKGDVNMLGLQSTASRQKDLMLVSELSQKIHKACCHLNPLNGTTPLSRLFNSNHKSIACFLSLLKQEVSCASGGL